MRLRLSLLLVAAVCLLTACSRRAEPADAGPGRILHVGNGAEPQDLDPHIVTGVTEQRLMTALFEGLVTEHPSGTGVAPGVAERWESSADGLLWTFHLRADARWSNGDPVTASDFLRSFRRILTPSLAAEYAYKLYHVVGAEEFNRGTLADFSATGFSAPDERTVVLRLKHRVPYLLESLKHASWSPVHAASIERFGPLDRPGVPWTRPGRLIGNGPFVLKTWLPNQSITVERSPTYWNTAATALDAVVFHAVDDLRTEERMFRAGQLHVTSSLPPGRIETWRAEAPQSLHVAPYYGVYFYRFNTTRPPLDDARVRRALSLAVDRAALVSAILRGGQEPAYQFTPSGAGFAPSERLVENLDEARRLLAEAGYPGGAGLRPIQILYNTQETHQAVAEAIQRMWKTRLGVDATLRNEEWKVYLDSQDNRDYDVARGGWIADYPDPHDFLDLWVSGGGNNDTGYASPDYDRLLATALQSPDETARMDVYRRLDALLLRDAPVLPLYFYQSIHLLDPRVRGWAPNILDLRGWQYVSLAPAAP